VETPEQALRCRAGLQKKGIYTKILPEALYWHFAGYWDHIPQIKQSTVKGCALNKSKALLENTIAIPIGVSLSEERLDILERAVSDVLIHG
jgi:8-amino-3,8-dideoxy-alpha-D-manno-octulosonate transaminase